jgi:hypothetical protein
MKIKADKKLKPCPFCGAKASFSEPMASIPGFQLGCSDREGCGVAPYSKVFASKIACIETWNKRLADEKLREVKR